MIKLTKNVFHLNTNNTSYIFQITDYGDLEHFYYGEKINFSENYDSMKQKRSMLLVSSLYPDGDVSYGIDDMNFEYSFFGRGDMNEPACLIRNEKDYLSFKYDGYEIFESLPDEMFVAHSIGADSCLKIILKEETSNVFVNLYFAVYENSDVITRWAQVDCQEGKVVVDKIMSAQLDFARNDLKLLTFDGAWSRERYKSERLLTQGKHINDSLSGASSARHNPFVIVAEKNADNHKGECFASNLIYSGNHCEMAEVSPYGNTRFLSGIGQTPFQWELCKGEKFVTPECVLSYSNRGYNGVSQNMHSFVNEHILRGYWKNLKKPVLANSWETMTFDLSDKKIRAFAEKTKEIGADLLVVDDGWFSKRNDDTTSLGDWFVEKDKFPDGLKKTADYVRELGLMFGLWFEPEMISRKSKLFQEHPDWALYQSGRTQIVGRNQYILDLSRQEVQDYIVKCLSDRIDEIGIDYIKWDFNRLFSDLHSEITKPAQLLHSYVIGLYKVMDRLTQKYPKVLFELCASGGTRFDLGMLCFMPVGWVSDNTDVMSRVMIQEGTSYGYPLSVMCNHISDCPNFHTKRVTAVSDRFNTASFGVMGFQYDLLKKTDKELQQIADLVKKYRDVQPIITDGTYYRLIDGFDSNDNSWMVVSKDQENAIVFYFQKLFVPVSTTPRLKLDGLNENFNYSVEDINMVSSGEMLMKNGLILPQNYQGNEQHQNGRMMADFSSVVYKLKRV